MDLDRDFWIVREGLFSCVVKDGQLYLVGSLVGEDVVGPCYGNLIDAQNAALAVAALI